MAAKFEVSKDHAGKFRFHLKAPNGEIIAASQMRNRQRYADIGCRENEMKTLRNLAAALILAAGLLAAPIAAPAVAHACVDVSGRHVSAGGCPGDDAARAAAATAADAGVDYGAPPCIAPDGTQYWTPGGEPC